MPNLVSLFFNIARLENTDAATKESASDLRSTWKPKSLSANSTLELVIWIGTHYSDLFALQISNAGLGNKIIVIFDAPFEYNCKLEKHMGIRPSAKKIIYKLKFRSSLNLCIPLGDPQLIHRKVYWLLPTSQALGAGGFSAIFHPYNDLRVRDRMRKRIAA